MLRFAMLIVGSLAASSFGQIIYEPVVTQYGGQNPYYYAGNDPYVHEAAKFPSVPGATFGRIPGYAFVSPTRQVVERNIRVFTDSFGTVDARPWGLTPNQVQNEANARLPRYVAKRDLLAAAKTISTPSGPTFVVAADATGPYAANANNGMNMPRGTMTIRPTLPRMYRNPLYVFPHGLLNRKLADVTGDKTRA